ncbi:flagellin [Rhodopseudomonas palustris]|uniref:flagellin n=1 Tax=Rhodopseudomonas palustris TaxID=1076 RepID=UPI000641D508|nr:flagellin [Rhodopseudomonas palustris]
MTMRVATFAASQQMIAAALKGQATMTTMQMQEASGVVSTDFGGYGSGAKQIVNLQVSVARAQTYIDTATQAGSKIEVMYASVNSIADLLSSFRSTLTAASNTASTDSSSVIQSAQDALNQMAALLNSKYGAQYLFGGARTDTAPVDVSSATYPAATTPSSADTSYYRGDDERASARVSDTQTVTYGVTADDPAFEQAMRAMNLIANASSLSSDTLEEALDLVTSATDAIGIVQSRISNSAASIERASTVQSDYQAFAQSLATDLTSVDVAAVTAALSTYQAQLTASYSAIATVQSLNLASYLR